MDTQEIDVVTDDGDELRTHPARARTELDQIARRAKRALAEHRIDLDVFFLVPNSGASVISYGCDSDPDDPTWERVGDIVADVLRQVIGLEGTQHTPVMCCATTDVVADTDHPSMLIPEPTLQNTGVEQ